MDYAVDNYNQAVEWGGASPTLRLVATDADHVPCVLRMAGCREDPHAPHGRIVDGCRGGQPIAVQRIER